MWMKLPNTHYFLSCTAIVDEIYVTDYLTVWFRKFSDEEFLKCAKNSNVSLKINESELVTKITDMLKNADLLKKVDIVLEEGNSSPSLTLHIMRSFGYPVKLKVVLTQGSKVVFFEKITKCLIETVRDLKASESELSDMLLKKDKEIKEYKEEGGKIALRHLKTPKFNETEHAMAHSCLQRHFGDQQSLVDTEEVLLRNKEDIIKADPVIVNEEKPSAACIKIKHEHHDVTAVDIKPESSQSLAPAKAEPLSQGFSPRKKKKKLHDL